MAERLVIALAITEKSTSERIENFLPKIDIPFQIHDRVINIDELLEIKRKNEINLIFLDLTFFSAKDKSSFYQIQSLFSNTSIIVITQPNDYHSVVEFMQMGAHGFLDKEITDKYMFECVVIQALDRLSVQKSLQESQRKLNNLMDNLPGVAYRCSNDAQYTMELLSAGCKSLTGYDPVDLLDNQHLSFNQLIHPDDRNMVWETIQKAVEKKQGYGIEYRIQTKEGFEKWVWEQGNAVQSGNGKTMLEGFITDITERQLRENQMRALIAISETIQKNLAEENLTDRIIAIMTEHFFLKNALLTLWSNTKNESFVQSAFNDWVWLKFEPVNLGSCFEQIEYAEKAVTVINSKNLQSESFPLLVEGREQNLAFIPLSSGQKSFGLLVLDRQQDYSENEKLVFLVITDMLTTALEHASLFKRTETQLHRMESLHTIDQAITGVFDLNIINNLIIQEAIKNLRADAISILHLNRLTNTLDCVETAGFKTQHIKGARIPISTSIAGKVLLDRKNAMIPDLTHEKTALFVNRRFHDDNFQAYFAAPLIVKGEPQGVLELFFKKYFYPDEDWVSFFNILSAQAALAYDTCRTFKELQKIKHNLSDSYQSALSTLTRSLELVEVESPGHAQRVASATLNLAKKLGVQKDALANIERGALLHDIGKIGILDEILLKKGDLNKAEWAQIKRHPEIAFELLSGVRLLRDALEIPYCHHENWDGSGYPRGLKGDEIPVAARIFAVIDSFDAIQSDRPYRKGKSREEAINFLINQKGKRFDPVIVDKYLSTMS